MSNYINDDIQHWKHPKFKDYKYFKTCRNEQDFIETEQVLFSLEWKHKPKLEKIYIIYNNKNFCYNIINEFGKWRVIAE